MRTKIYLLTAVCFGIFGYSFASELFVRVNQGGNYQMSIGAQLQSSAVGDFKFYNVSAGQQKVIISNLKNGSILFNNYLIVGQDQRIYADLMPNGVLNISQIQAMNNSSGWGNEPTVGSVNYGGYGNNGYPGYGNYPNQSPGYGQSNGCGHDHHGNNGWGNNGTYYQTNNYSDNANFQALISTLKNESFDSDRLTTAINYAKLASLSAYQIAEMTKTFTYDSSKLDFAKTAYSSCYDKQNYFQLKSAFTYSSTYDDLMEAIQQ